MKHFYRYISTRPFSWFAIFTLLALGLIVAGCGSSSSANSTAADAILAQIPRPNVGVAQAPGTFLGKVAGSEYFIGLVIQGDTAVGYLCDGQTDAWLKGTVKGDQVTLSSESGAAVTATLAGSTVIGKVTPAGGSALDFTASPPQGEDGFYRAVVPASEDENYVAGWIYVEDDVRGLIRRIIKLIRGLGKNGGGGNGLDGGSAIQEPPECNQLRQEYNDFQQDALCTQCSAADLQASEDFATTAIGEAMGLGCDLSGF